MENPYLGGGFKYFQRVGPEIWRLGEGPKRWKNIFLGILTPTVLGKMVQFDERIFQMGWFNHQLAIQCEQALRLKRSQQVRGKLLLIVQKSGEFSHLGCMSNPVNNGINYQPQLVIARFPNHQQYAKHA